MRFRNLRLQPAPSPAPEPSEPSGTLRNLLLPRAPALTGDYLLKTLLAYAVGEKSTKVSQEIAAVIGWTGDKETLKLVGGDA